VAATIEISGMDSAALALVTPGRGFEVTSAGGPLAGVLTAIDDEDLDHLAGLVEAVASCHTAGDSMGAGFVGTDALRAAGACAIVVVPLGSRGRSLGVLLVASTQPHRLESEEVEMIELLAVQAATCLDNAAMVSELRDRSLRDPLTGLRNHSAFHEELDVSLTTRDRGTWMLLLADIDRFKNVNDTAGHLVGDEVLRAVAVALLPGVREGDLVFRLGGDEFAMIVHGVDEGQALAIAHRIITDAAQVCLEPYGASLSIGVAASRLEEDRRALIERADRALYRAKRDGGGVCLAALDEPRVEAPKSRRASLQATSLYGGRD
jgi:diguanylate cyclase (GGDEF)-like protein